MSDTMCAKTTETSRCQRCGSEFDWLSDGTKVHAGKQYFESDSLLCLERQLNAANDRIKQLEDRINRASIAFFEDGSDGHIASQMLQILEEERGKK